MKKKEILRYIKEEAGKLGFERIILSDVDHDFFINTVDIGNSILLDSETLYVNRNHIKRLSKLKDKQLVRKSLNFCIKHEKGHVMKPSCVEITKKFLNFFNFKYAAELQAILNSSAKLFKNNEELTDLFSARYASVFLLDYKSNSEKLKQRVKEIIKYHIDADFKHYCPFFNKKFKNQVIERTWKYILPYL